MSDTTAKEVLLVVIFPYKFTDFRYDNMTLGDFKPHCDVIVLDMSMITARKMSKAVVVKRSEKLGVVALSSLLSLIRYLYKLRKLSTKTNIYILNKMSSSLPAEVLCNLIIAAFLRRKCAFIDECNGGVPVYYCNAVVGPDEFDKNSGYLAKIRRFARRVTTLSEAWQNVIGFLCGSLNRFVPSVTTHRLIAGEDWLKVAEQKKPANNQIKVVFGHSPDYSNMLLQKVKSPAFVSSRNKTAVLLDASTPMFKSDYVLMRRKDTLTSDVWYPTLTRFIDRLEADAGVKVEIAGHYKSVHPAIAPCFGNRPVHYGKTIELVRSSDFVITRMSCAISYAVMFKKPVIFIYSNQIKKNAEAMRKICGMAAMLGTEPVNIDEPLIEIEGLLKIDEKRYRNYEKVCLTSTSSQKSNVQIILEDIMNINTGSDFTRPSPNWTIK